MATKTGKRILRRFRLPSELTTRIPSRSPLLAIIAVVELIFLSLPSAIILVTSIVEEDYIYFPPESFSLRWYTKIPNSPEFITAFKHSLIVSTLATLICMIAGTLAAYGLMRYNVRFKRHLQSYYLLPFIIPLVTSGIMLFIIYGRLQILGEIWVVGLTLGIVMFPLMFWSVSASVNAIDPTLENAAKSLGAEELQTFLFVTLPLIAPGIVSGALLVFVVCLNEFVVSLFVVVPDTATLPVMLYNSINKNLTPFLASVSAVYVIVAIIAVYVFDRTVGLEQFFYS